MKNLLMALGIALMLLGGYLLFQSNVAVGGGAFAVGLLALAASRRKS